MNVIYSVTSEQVQAGVALLALLLALATIVNSARVQREQTARKAHLDYLHLAIAYPNLAIPDKIKLRKENGELFEKDHNEDFERYEWFVSYMLSTAGFVWESIDKKDHILRSLMTLQIAYHAEYLSLYKERKPYLRRWFKKYNKELGEGMALVELLPAEGRGAKDNG